MLLGTYSPAAHRGIARYAAEHGWHLHADMARIPVVPFGWRGDGIVAGLGEWDEPVRFVQSKGVAAIPKVDIYTMRPEIRIPRVVGDHREVGRQAALHLLRAGWRRFGWFSRVDHFVARLRFEGFRNEIAKAGRGSPMVLAPAFTLSSPARDWEASRAGLVNELRRASLPLGVMAFNDYDAALLETACLDAGLTVPDDIGIVGVDNNELVVDCQPVGLSSVQLDLERIGYEGAALLDRLMDGAAKPREPFLIAPRGVVARASTAATPASDAKVREAVKFLNGHFAEKITVDRVAARCRVSRRTLEMAFRRDLERTVHAQLVRVRLQEACRLLIGSSEPIADIARKCGFAHGPHLHVEFKRSFGVSPRNWRLGQRSEPTPPR